jgi:hypothetical protein
VQDLCPEKNSTVLLEEIKDLKRLKYIWSWIKSHYVNIEIQCNSYQKGDSSQAWLGTLVILVTWEVQAAESQVQGQPRQT